MRDRGWRRFTTWKKERRLRRLIRHEKYFASSTRTIHERENGGSYIWIGSRMVLRRTLKRQSRKKLRHAKDLPMRGKGCRKYFDYWWLHD